MPPPQKIFRFLCSKTRVLMHSGCYFTLYFYFIFTLGGHRPPWLCLCPLCSPVDMNFPYGSCTCYKSSSLSLSLSSLLHHKTRAQQRAEVGDRGKAVDYGWAHGVARSLLTPCSNIPPSPGVARSLTVPLQKHPALHGSVDNCLLYTSPSPRDS